MAGASEGLYRAQGLAFLLNQEGDRLGEVEHLLADLGDPPTELELAVELFGSAVAGAEQSLSDAAFWIGADRSGHDESIEAALLAYLESVTEARATISSFPTC